jgi:hypothetical protein
MTPFTAGQPVRLKRSICKGEIPSGLEGTILRTGRPRGCVQFTAGPNKNVPDGLTIDLPPELLEPIESMNAKNMAPLIAESHRRQFAGEDYQYVAIGIAESNGIKFEDEEYTQLQSAPDPNCGCQFCTTAPFED